MEEAEPAVARLAGDPAPAEPAALVSQLAAQVESLAGSERELRRLLNEAHAQIGGRDEQIQRLLAELERARFEREDALAHAARARATVDTMRATRVWRAGTLFWRVRELVRRG